MTVEIPMRVQFYVGLYEKARAHAPTRNILSFAFSLRFLQRGIPAFKPNASDINGGRKVKERERKVEKACFYFPLSLDGRYTCEK